MGGARKNKTAKANNTNLRDNRTDPGTQGNDTDVNLNQAGAPQQSQQQQQDTVNPNQLEDSQQQPQSYPQPPPQSYPQPPQQSYPQTPQQSYPQPLQSYPQPPQQSYPLPPQSYPQPPHQSYPLSQQQSYPQPPQQSYPQPPQQSYPQPPQQSYPQAPQQSYPQTPHQSYPQPSQSYQQQVQSNQTELGVRQQFQPVTNQTTNFIDSSTQSAINQLAMQALVANFNNASKGAGDMTSMANRQAVNVKTAVSNSGGAGLSSDSYEIEGLNWEQSSYVTGTKRRIYEQKNYQEQSVVANLQQRLKSALDKNARLENTLTYYKTNNATLKAKYALKVEECNNLMVLLKEKEKNLRIVLGQGGTNVGNSNNFPSYSAAASSSTSNGNNNHYLNEPSNANYNNQNGYTYN